MRAYKATSPAPASPDAPAANVVQFQPDHDDHELTPFPTDCLPGAMGDMARAIAQTTGVPESLTASCVLAIISAAFGAGLEVRSGGDQTTGGHLYILASAQTGTGKSKSFRLAAQPLFEYEREIIEQWRTSILPGLQADKDLIDSEILAIKKQAGKAESGIDREARRQEIEAKRKRLLEIESLLQAPVLMVEDITNERLASLLAARGETLASLSPDAGNIVNNLLGRYNKTDRTDENVYLKAYSREYCRVDRQGRPPVVLHHPCLVVLWLTQPDKLATLLGTLSLTDGGFIPRLLICHTNCQPQYITGEQQGISSAVLSAYDGLIRDLLQTYRQAAEAHTLEPTLAAMQLLNDYYNAIISRRLSDLKDVTGFAARWAEQAWRLCVVLHAAQYGAQAHEQPISATTATAAITIADWFAEQQLDILKVGRWQAKRDRENEVLKLLADNPTGINARDVYRRNIAKTPDEARDLLAAMEQDGQLIGSDSKPEHGGKTSRIYTRKQGR